MTPMRQFYVLGGDILILIGSFFLTILLRHQGRFSPDLIEVYFPSFIFLYLLWILILYIFNLYEIHNIKPNFLSLRQIILALITQSIVGFLMFYFISYFGITPKTTMFLNVAVFGILFIGWRTAFYNIVAYRFQKKLAILDVSEETQLLIEEINKNPHVGYKYIGNFSSVEEMNLQKINPDIIVLGKLPHTEGLLALSNTNADILHISEAFQRIFFKIPVTLINDHSATDLIEKKESELYSFVRRVSEIFFSITILIITLPITLLTSIAILLEDGKPIFLKQARVGKRNKIFNIIKFRSMIVLSKDGSAEDSGAKWASHNDPRITRVGKIIRKLHIDEIPQMINVLKGDLALVGPRAERPEFVTLLEKEIPYYFLRHIIKPGFTGWAQIKFRYARTELDSREKFEYDLFYLKNRNVFLDIGIILKTIQIIFTH